MLLTRIASVLVAGSLSFAAISLAIAQSPSSETSGTATDHGHSGTSTQGASEPDATGSGMMGDGNMMMGPGMMQLGMMAAMDADGDGAVSLAEFQAVHERMFGYLDADGDGRLTREEVGRATQGMSAGAGRSR